MNVLNIFDWKGSSIRDTTKQEIGFGDIEGFREKLLRIEQEQQFQRDKLERLTVAYEMVCTGMDIRFEGLRESVQQECIDTCQDVVGGLQTGLEECTKQTHESMDGGAVVALGSSSGRLNSALVGLQTSNINMEVLPGSALERPSSALPELQRGSMATMKMLNSINRIDHRTSLERNLSGSSSLDPARTLSHVETAIQQGSYVLSESVYDSAMLLFSKLVHVEDSWMMMFGLLACILMQLLLVVLVANLVDPKSVESSPEVYEAAIRWRYDHAHLVRNSDQVQRISLARSVCAGTSSLPISEGQVRMISIIRAYRDSSTWGIPEGMIAVSVVLAIWIIFITKEVGDCLRMFVAILSVDRGWKGHLRFSPSVADGVGLQFNIFYLTGLRCILVFCVGFARLSVALSLCILGCRWLVYTVSLTDLILNASALQFIVDADDTLFALLASAEFAWILQHMAPVGGIVIKQSRRCHLLIPALTLLLGAIVWISFMVGLAGPNVGRMHDLEEAFCGGWKDFVFVLPVERPGEERKFFVASAAEQRAPQWFDEQISEIIRNGNRSYGTMRDLYMERNQSPATGP